MYNKTKHIVFALSLMVLSNVGFSQLNDECPEMEPICPGAGLSFTANATGIDAEDIDPGNNYGCLGSSPDPAWYYMQIDQSGNINTTLSAPSDIDFILWGPFANLAAAQAQCGNLGNGGAGMAIEDCSYLSDAIEFPNITGGISGEVYVLLITNFAGAVQPVTLVENASTGTLDCSIIIVEPCVSDPGTYQIFKNGNLTSAPIYLCEGETFAANSNNDYILPNDTIALPVGDGGYSSQLMWLVYDAFPVSSDPNLDPGFLNFIIPDEDLADVNNGTSPIIANLGCGKYWFVPVAGDDGIGGNNNIANGTNDNGGLHWDKNNNGCYLLGTPLEVEYACPMVTTPSVHCNPPSTINGIDVQITGGSGNYTVINQGAGNLVSGSVPNGGTAHVNNLNNNNVWEIDIVDGAGCTATETGIFEAPVISNVTIVPALTCPLGGDGDVNVTVNGTSGNGAPYIIVMAGDPPTPGTTDSYSDVAGTLVNIIVSDAAGCISDSIVTITSAGHFIDVDVLTLQGELCYGDGNGAASISAIPTPTGTVTNITWTGPSGQNPGGDPGGPANNSQSGLEPGNWSITILDNTGCEVTIPITITSPQELDLYVANSNEPVCYDFGDGSITVQSTGGSGGLVYSWSLPATSTTNTANLLEAGIYWAYVTDQNGCQDSVMIDLGQPDSLYADFIVKNILCYGDTSGGIIVDNVYNNIGGVSYFWNLAGVIPNPPATSNTSGALPVGTYVITIQDALCSNQYEFTLTQNPPIVLVDFGSEPAYCRTFSYQSGNGVVFGSASGGVPDYEYLWTNLGTGATTNNTTWGGLNPGTYELTVTDDVNCTLVQTMVLDSVNPIADFTVTSAKLDGNLEGTAVVCATFTNQSQYFANPNDPAADTTFFWELGYNLPWQISHSLYEEFDTCYYEEGLFEVCLVAINKNDCSDTSCQTLIIHDFPGLPAPNIFTPGGDNVNELFEFNSKQVAIVTFECVVVDRWGKQIFVFDEITDGWDGNNKKGNPCDDGVYFYTYTGTSTNGTVFEGQGTVTLIRGQQ